MKNIIKNIGRSFFSSNEWIGQINLRQVLNSERELSFIEMVTSCCEIVSIEHLHEDAEIVSVSGLKTVIIASWR